MSKGKKEDEYYKQVFELSFDYAYAFRVEPDGKLVNEWVTGAILRITGYTPEEIAKRGGWESLIYPDDMNIPLGQLRSVLNNRPEMVEYRILKKDGSMLWMRDYAKPVFDDEQNRVTYIYGAVLDISDHKFAESTLRAEKEKVQKYLDIAGVMFVAINADQEVTLINQKGCEILGYSEEDIIGKNWFDNFLPESMREEVKSVFDQLIAGKIEPVEYYENLVVTKSGEERVIAWRNCVLRDDNGKIIGTLSSGNDSTEHSMAEKALRDSEEKFRMLFENAAEGILFIDTEGNIQDANPRVMELGGCQREDVVGKNFIDIVELFKLDLTALTNNFELLLEGSEKAQMEWELTNIKGEQVVVQVIPSLTRKNDEVIGITCILEEITERKKAVEALKASEKRFRELTELLPQTVFEVDLEGNYRFVNRHFLDSLGYNKMDIERGLNISDVLIPEDLNKARENMRKVLTGEGDSGNEYTGIGSDGKVFPIVIYSRPIIEGGRPVGLLGIVFDITDRKSAEQKMLEEQKLAKLYLDLMGHDVNNINQAILMSGELLLIKNELSEDVKKYLTNIINQSKRISELISNVRKLSDLREGKIQKQNIDIATVLNNSIDHILQANDHRTIKINNEVPVGKMFSNTSESIQDLFDNVIGNAIKFDPSDEVEIDILHALSEDGKYWKLEFQDNGPGVPDDIKESIFKRLSKGDDSVHGSGLGLTLAHEIVSCNGGKIWVEDRIEDKQSRGSNFVVMLPREDLS